MSIPSTTCGWSIVVLSLISASALGSGAAHSQPNDQVANEELPTLESMLKDKNVRIFARFGPFSSGFA